MFNQFSCYFFQISFHLRAQLKWLRLDEALERYLKHKACSLLEWYTWGHVITFLSTGRASKRAPHHVISIIGVSKRAFCGSFFFKHPCSRDDCPLPLLSPPVIGGSSPVAERTCWWPAGLYANSVRWTQSPLCGSSTVACCDCGCLNRGPVCPFMSGTCVLLLNIAATMARGNACLKNWPQIISVYSLSIKLKRHLCFHWR